MRKSRVSGRKILVVLLAVVIVVGIGIITMFNGPSEYVAKAGDNIYSNGTYLSGQGLMFGENILLTRANSDEGDGAGNLPGSGAAHTVSRDIYVESSSNYNYSPNGLTFNNGIVGSKLRLDSTTSWNGVFSAIKDPNMKTDFWLDASINNDQATSASVNITINWHASGSSTPTHTTSVNRTVPAGGSVSANLEMNNIIPTGLNGNCYFIIRFQSSGSLRIVNPRVIMSVNLENVSINSASTYTITGPNRQPFTVATSDNEYSAKTQNIYVKTGDKIRLETKAHLGGAGDLYLFPSYFLSVFSLTLEHRREGANPINVAPYAGNQNEQVSGISWSTGSSTGTNYLRKVEHTGEGYYNTGEDSGYYVEFIVGDGVYNAEYLYIDPFIYTGNGINGKIPGIQSAAQQRIAFKVDSNAPNIPIIDPTSDLGRAISSDSWFTDSLSTRIPFPTPQGAELNSIKSKEHIYAFVCDQSVTALDFSNYDYTLDIANSSLSYYVGGTERIAVRQQIHSRVVGSGGVVYTNENCNFGAAGEYTLILVAVDEAGNVSTPKIYSKHGPERRGVKVDNTPYIISLEFRLGQSIVAGPAMNSIAEVFMIVNNHSSTPPRIYHDENGNLANGNDPDYQQYFTNEFKNRNSAKRLQYVTVRVAMTNEKMANYELVNYTNNFNVVNASPVFKIPTASDRRSFIDITFKMDDGVIDNNALKIECYFRERVNIQLNKNVYIFNGNEVNLLDNVEAFRRNTNELVQEVGFSVKYYNTLNYIVFPNMVGQTVGIGGTINLAGQEYTNTTQNLIQTNQIITINNNEYYTINAVRNANVNNKVNYTITAYSVGDYLEWGFVDAGSYWFRIDVDRAKTTKYFGSLEGTFRIERASPEVTGLTAAEALIYGAEDKGKTGLDLLKFNSKGPNNVDYLYTDVVSFAGGETYYKSFSGVVGKYFIISPTGQAYYNPDVVSRLTITVEFRPIDITIDNEGKAITAQYITANWGYYMAYYDKISDNVYTLKPGGKHSLNYANQNISMDIVVNPAKATINVVGAKEFTYDGEEKFVNVESNPGDLPYIISYAKQITPDSNYYEEYTSALPYNAGKYRVKLVVDSSKSNYYSDEVITEIDIFKRHLDLSALNTTLVSAEYPAYYEDNITYTRYVEYAYGRLNKPRNAMDIGDNTSEPLISMKYTYLGDVFDINVGYEIAYKKVRDVDGNLIEGGVYTEYTEYPDATLFDSGTYLAKLRVKNNNNQGEIILMHIITPALFDDSTLKIMFPEFRTEYSVYNLGQDIPVRQGGDDTIGHIEYGQNLAKTSAALMIMGAGNVANYQYRGTTSATQIPGRFYLSDEIEIFTLNRIEGLPLGVPDINAEGDYVLPVRYEWEITSQGVIYTNTVTTYVVRLYWEAGEYENDVFVPNKNFSLSYASRNIYVARATATFDNVKIEDIVYGDPISSSHFTGNPEGPGGFVFTEDMYSLTWQVNGSTIYPRGTHNVMSTFIPNEEYIRNFRNLPMRPIPLTVTPKPATITFVRNAQNRVAHYYGSPYIPPVVITAPQAGIPVSFAYETLDGEPIIIRKDTPIGVYRVIATINDENYGGSTTSEFFVEKGELFAASTPVFPDPPQYGITLGDIPTSRLAGIVMNSSNDIYDGFYQFVDDNYDPINGVSLSTIPDVGLNTFKLRFVPNREDAKENYNTFYYMFTFTIQKARVEISVSALNQTYSAEPIVPNYSAVRPDGTSLTVRATYLTPNEQPPINAGTYTVTFVVDDAQYTGETTRTLTVNKAPVTITGIDNIKTYTGSPQRVSYLYTPDAEMQFTHSYTDHQGFPVENPTEVGKYLATVTVVSDNYVGVALLEMNIKPASVVFENLTQTYGSIVPVTVQFSPSPIYYTVQYQYNGAGMFLPAPELAGSYNVKVIVEQNGYYEEITRFEDGSPVILTVQKAVAVITANEVYVRNYTSTSHDLGIVTSVIGVTLNYSYLAEGGTQYTTVPPVTVGRYDVKAEISDINYQGSINTVLIINPAKLEIREKPIITSINYYSRPSSEVEYMGGFVMFPATGQNLVEAGHWAIAETNTTFRSREVGVHLVPLVFVPDDSLNFDEVYDSINILISKLDISPYIRFNAEDLSQGYNQQQLSVSAYLDKEAFYQDTGNDMGNTNNLVLRVTYNGTQTRPISVGEYALNAIIEDKNYEGTFNPEQQAVFRINKADLSIELPALRAINVGEPLSASLITGGFAYIKKTNPSDPVRSVNGTFRFTYPSLVMQKANYHPVFINFTPNDEVNHNSTNFQMNIFVKGIDVEVWGVAATGITYGQPLSASTLTFTDSSQEGDIQWANPNAILNVGEVPRYIFTPYEKDVYNIQEGTVALTIAQAQLIENVVSAKVYVEEYVRDARLDINFFHAEYPNNPNWLVNDYTITITNKFGNYDTRLNIDDWGIEFPVGILVTHRNYEEKEFDVLVRAYKRLAPQTFLIKNTSKSYDGKVVTASDFKVEIAIDSYVIKSGFVISSITQDGYPVTEILNAGKYRVTLAYNDSEYDGATTFDYTVNKYDLSGAIKLAEGGNTVERVYSMFSGDIQLEFWDANGTYDIPRAHLNFEYLSKDGKVSYAGDSPKNAGEYIVKISVLSINKNFSGTITFAYNVAPMVAEIRLQNSYSFTYGSLLGSIVPTMEISGATYYLTFNGNRAYPENVGQYTVLAHIEHDNYHGTSAPATLTITRAAVRINEEPVLGSIKYGQKLSDATITGGSAAAGQLGDLIAGSFYFVNPDASDYPVGLNYVEMIFTPVNQNYADYRFSILITVEKAIGSIEVKSLSATYTGSRINPDVVTQPDPNIRLDFEYLQNGRQVEPINAGEYMVRIRIVDDNYTGSIEGIFIINKVHAIEVVAPVPSSVAYGQSLEYSALVGGRVTYFEWQTNPAEGKFEYSESAVIPGNAGRSYEVEYRFVPSEADQQNYEIYVGTVWVEVVKANAVISVTGNDFIYGDQITEPIFVTNPTNLRMLNMQFLNSEFYTNPQSQNVGSYQFSAYVEDENYKGDIIYIISITKKKLEVQFINASGNAVDRYTTKYKQEVYAKTRVVVSSLINRDIPQVAEIEKNIMYAYKKTNTPNAEIMYTPPKNVGSYSVTASINHQNYYFNANEASVLYTIERGTVEKLEFDISSLSAQTYGSVTWPIVNVSPSDVQYRILFESHEFLPDAAGTYNITVVVTDPNYMPINKESMFTIRPKAITIENIKVFNKPEDGLSDIQITGELRGIMTGDEVFLSMTAKTRGRGITMGSYDVDILSWDITGLDSANYRVVEPLYNNKVRIIAKAITDPLTGSYITSPAGFSSNITVDFTEVRDAQNNTNAFTALFGQKAVVQSIVIKENGIETVLEERVKFYVKIPDKYLNVENLSFAALGTLSTQSITFEREGDYITFYADRSGEVMIYANDFPYWIVIVGGAILMVVLGGLFIALLNPVRKRMFIKRGVRTSYNNLQKARARTNN
ncbi:MAG: MBG domain-containing protein [Clostridia bacterium]